MNDEYVVWLLVAALVGAGALLWFLYGRLPREEDDVSGDELVAEAAWISDALAELGTTVDADAVEEVLRLHRHYLAGVVPPREPGDPGWPLPADSPGNRAGHAPAASTGSRASARDETAVERDGARREAPEADVGQAG